MTTASAADPRAETFAFALAAEFPEINAAELQITEDVVSELSIVTWDEWVVCFPQSEAAAARLTTLANVMPHLRGFLSPAVSSWEHASLGQSWQRSWRAARQLDGRPLQPELIVDQNRERIVRALANFLHELHQFSVERARGLGLGPAREWRAEHDQLGKRSLAILRPLLSWSEMARTRRWWIRFLNDDSIWQFQPCPVHSALAAEQLLVDPFVRDLVAVDGWYQLRIADPAIDFARLVNAYGADFGWRIVESYGELGSTADAALFRRVRLLLTARRYRDVVQAAGTGVDNEAMSRALSNLRQA